MKKVLIITYYWPPSGGSGVQRWLKTAKYLPEFGYEPIIYTPDIPGFGIQDKSLADDGLKGIKVLRRPIWDPGTMFSNKGKSIKVGELNKKTASLFFKLAIWLRGNIFIPDSKIFWVKPSLKYLTKYLKKNKIDVMVTTGPPHSMHMIGFGLNKILGIKWLADFRDPWSDWDILDQLYTSNFARTQHRKMESNVLSKADVVITVGKRLGDGLIEKVPECNLEIVTNGFDEDDFNNIEKENSSDKFTLTYSGLIYNNRNPKLLWQVLNDLCLEDEGFSNQLVINIAGIVAEDVRDDIMQYQLLASKVNFIGYVLHQESIELCQQSSLLMLAIDNTKNSRILTTGKLFEYLATQVPIIGFGELDSDANDILVDTGHNPLIDYADRSKIKSEIITYYENYKNGVENPEYRYLNYSRRNLAGKIGKILDNIT